MYVRRGYHVLTKALYDLDTDITSRIDTATAGVIPVISGTMGEAPHLVRIPPRFSFSSIPPRLPPLKLTTTNTPHPLQSHKERQSLITTARHALDEANLPHVPIIAGIGAPSTRESIELAHEAAAAGADFAIAIAPGYYAGALLARPESVRDFFVDVAEGSPIPV